MSQGVRFYSKASLYSYELDKDDEPMLPQPKVYYTDQELSSRYDHQRVYLKTIPPDTLEWIYNIASTLSGTSNSDTVNAGNDMGGLTYTVYVYDPEQSKYRVIVLRQDGDWVFYNKSQNAIALVQWMKGL